MGCARVGGCTSSAWGREGMCVVRGCVDVCYGCVRYGCVGYGFMCYGVCMLWVYLVQRILPIRFRLQPLIQQSIVLIQHLSTQFEQRAQDFLFFPSSPVKPHHVGSSDIATTLLFRFFPGLTFVRCRVSCRARMWVRQGCVVRGDV